MEFFMMKKTAIALGIAAMTFGAQAAEWMVTPDHSFAVNADVGACFQNNVGTTTGQVTSTIYGCSNNQIQLKSTKTLSNGIKLIGQIEVDFDPTLDNSFALSDDMRVGVDVPVWGKLVAGQFDSFYEDNVSEALGFWGVGDIGAYVDEPISFVAGAKSRGAVKSKALEYYNQYENFSLAITLNAGYQDTNMYTPMYGVATVLGYKSGDFQMYFGSAVLPAYYSDTVFTTSSSTSTTVLYRANPYTNATGVTANYTMGNTKVAGLVYTAQTLAGAMYNWGGFSVEQTIDAWKLGFTMQNANYGGSAQYSQYAVGANYTFVKNARVYVEAHTLGVANSYGDTFEVGMKYSF
jgi:predicted porin